MITPKAPIEVMAIKNMKKALETDLPRRFRSAVRKMLEEKA